MQPTLAAFSKASRRALISKRGNKDFYKGYGAARLPGGHRTGAPGKHVIRGKAKYRIIDEQVRVYIAPPIEHILASPLKAYVYGAVDKWSDDAPPVPYQQQKDGFSGEYWLGLMRKHAPITPADPAAPTTTQP